VIRVLVADDHGVLRDGLGRLISAQPDMELAGMAANGAEAIEMCRSEEPDVVLMDLEMPVLDGIEATRAIAAQTPTTEDRGVPGSSPGLAIGSDLCMPAAHRGMSRRREFAATPFAPLS